jgi:hypothetical protein
MANDNDDAHSRKLNAAGLILCDAIANALNRLRQEMPGLTAEETAVVFETAVKVIRQSEGWPNRVASFGRILATDDPAARSRTK